MIRSKRRAKLLAGIAVTSLVIVAACGGDDDDDATDGTEAVVEGTEPVATEGGADTTAAPEGTEAPTDETEPEAESTDPPTTEEGDEERPASPGESHVTEDEGEPVQGGTLRYGVEADTANGWAHYRVSCAISCFNVISSITDPLFDLNDDGDIVPNLVDTAEPNADFTEWTLTIRDGITFHDGTPLDAEAVRTNMVACKNSPLTGLAYGPLGDITADGQTLTIATAGGPWVALPYYFSAGAQCGYMFSGQWLNSLADLPQRQEASPSYDAELAATPADGVAAEPVGLGAFVYESYTPGNANSFRAVRNEDYWRGPNGITGETLPYVDAVEIIPFADVESRTNALRSGEIGAMHTANADTISQFLGDDEFELTSGDRFAETGYILLNHAAGEFDPEGKNASNPLLNLSCRRALAHATDRDRIAEERGASLVTQANGPFPPGSIGYLEDTGYPDFDADAAVAEMDTCLSELGTDSIEFTFNTTNDPFNVETNTLIISMWTEVFGDQVRATITPIEQGAYIGLALGGAFQAQGWRQHAGYDPDSQRVWWEKATVAPIGALSVNFGRFVDDVIDENLQVIKTNPDPEARREATENVNRRFGEQVYELWLTYTLWGTPTQTYVNGVETNNLVAGGEGLGWANGFHRLNQVWCDDGACE